MRLEAAILLCHASDTPSEKIKITQHGLPITIEHQKGSERVLHDDLGREVYRKKMQAHYGYINHTKGRDGDEVDCFLGPNPNAKNVYVMHMKDLGPVKEEREDEDKVMLGFDSAMAAEQCFLAHYPKSFLESISSMPVALFKKKLKEAQKPHHAKKIHAGTEKCPRCGSRKFMLMPTDFETAKCKKCGKLYHVGA